MMGMQAVMAVWAGPAWCAHAAGLQRGQGRVAVEPEHPGGLVALAAPGRPRGSRRRRGQFGG
jgi:hypothetical protein